MSDATGPLAGFSAVAPHYAALFCDLWGVVHNGVWAFPPAIDALRRYRAQGGVVVFVSNAPRPHGPITAMLDELGVTNDCYDGVVSSGDTTRAMIAPYRGRVIHHVGPATEDDALYAGLGVVRGAAEQAEAVVVTDLDNNDQTPDDYAERLQLWKARNLPLICANPDRVVEMGDKMIYCAGAIADAYEAIGGTVLMAGKPHAPIYNEALKLAERAAGQPLAREHILGIGDSVRTDLMGAAGFGIPALFITGSIHAEDIPSAGPEQDAAVRKLAAPSGARLAGYMPHLAW